MADVGFKWYLLTFTVASLFIVSMFSFGTQVLDNANSSVGLVDEERFNVDRVEDNLDTINTRGENLRDSFYGEETPTWATGVLSFLAIWGILYNSVSLVSTSMSLFLDLIATTLGIPAIAVGVLITILIIGLIFAGWRILKLGE